MWTRKFWTEAADRALKSAAQALLLLWGASTLDVLHADYLEAAGLGGGAALLSVLTSIASSKIGDKSSPSVLG